MPIPMVEAGGGAREAEIVEDKRIAFAIIITSYSIPVNKADFG